MQLTDSVWDTIQNMPALRILDISYNDLSSIPPDLAAACPHTEILVLSVCRIFF